MLGKKYTCMKQYCHILSILKLYCKYLSEYNFYILHQMYKYSILNQTEAVYFFNSSQNPWSVDGPGSLSDSEKPSFPNGSRR